jgi:hypothetical protein
LEEALARVDDALSGLSSEVCPFMYLQACKLRASVLARL